MDGLLTIKVLLSKNVAGFYFFSVLRSPLCSLFQVEGDQNNNKPPATLGVLSPASKGMLWKTGVKNIYVFIDDQCWFLYSQHNLLSHWTHSLYNLDLCACIIIITTEGKNLISPSRINKVFLLLLDSLLIRLYIYHTHIIKVEYLWMTLIMKV